MQSFPQNTAIYPHSISEVTSHLYLKSSVQKSTEYSECYHESVKCTHASGSVADSGCLRGRHFIYHRGIPEGYFQSIFFFQTWRLPRLLPHSPSPPLNGIELKVILKNKEFFSGVVLVKICMIREYFTFYKLSLLLCFRETRPGLPVSFVRSRLTFQPSQ